MPEVTEKNALGIEMPNTPQKKTNKKLVLGIVLGALGFLVVFGAIAGYGFYNGSRIKKYAVASEKMMSEPQKWEKIFDTEDMTKVKTELKNVEKYCDEQLTVLGKPAPKKAKKLRSDLVEYFTLSKKAVASITEVVDWTIEVEDAMKDLEKMENPDVTSPEAMVRSLEDGKRQIDTTVAKMEKMNVPDSLKKDHESVKDMFKKLSKAYDSIITGVKGNDLTAILTSGEELAGALEGFDPEMFGGDLAKSFEKESEKADDLERDINSQIIELKAVNFSF